MRASILGRYNNHLAEKRSERSRGANPKPRGPRARTTAFDIGMVARDKSAAAGSSAAADEATPMDSEAEITPPTAAETAPTAPATASPSPTPAAACDDVPLPRSVAELEAELARLRQANAVLTDTNRLLEMRSQEKEKKEYQEKEKESARMSEAQWATICALEEEAKKAKKTITQLQAEAEQLRLQQLGEALSNAARQHERDNINYVHLQLSGEARSAYMHLKESGRHRVAQCVAAMIVELFNGAGTEVLRSYGMSISQVTFNLHKRVKASVPGGDDGLSEMQRKTAYLPEAQMSLYFQRNYTTGELLS